MLRRYLLLLALCVPMLSLAQDPPAANASPATEPPAAETPGVPQTAASETASQDAASAAAPVVDVPATAPTPAKAKAGKNTKGKGPKTTPVAATATPPAAAPATDGLPPNEQYRRDLVNLLALRTDPPLLLAAAVLARPDAADETRAHGLQSPALLERAQTSGPKDALVWWITAFACEDALKPCPQPQALQQLTQIAADNAAVWVLQAQQAQKNGDRAGADAALARAGAAREYNDYNSELTRVLLQAIGDLPVPPELLAHPPQGVAATPSGIELILAYNLGKRFGPGAQPAAAAALLLCDPGTNAAQFATRRKDCQALAGKLEWSTTLLAQRAGLALRLKLSGKASDADIENKQRNIAWQEQRSAEIMQALLADPTGSRQLAQLMLQSHAESGLVYALLRGAKVPLEAPLDAPADAAAEADPPAQN